jgi:predicted Ser/Thr protein kinase
MADFVGRQFGNYRLLRLIGQGGFADVYLGEHVHLGTMAAIKILKTQLAGSDVEQFRKEARFIAHFKNEHIVHVLDFGVENSIPFLVMEYAQNGTLRQRHPSGIPLSPALIISYVKQVTDALQYAHNQNVIHRDVKPENMLLDSDNKVLLSDFGLAMVNQSSRYQTAMEMAGTVAYMAPEQTQGRVQIASDQYSLGVVVYEWLCGKRPFNGTVPEVIIQHISAPPPSLRQQVPTLPADVEEVVFKALAKAPQQRFATVQAFANALTQACAPLLGNSFTQASTQVNTIQQTPIPKTERANSSDNLASAQVTMVLSTPSGRMPLSSAEFKIGRAADNQLILNDGQVSGYHALLRSTPQGYVLIDTNSTNGTFLNDRRLLPQVPYPLTVNDTIRFGQTRCTYEQVGQVAQLSALPTERALSSNNSAVTQVNVVVPPPPPTPVIKEENRPVIPPQPIPVPPPSPKPRIGLWIGVGLAVIVVLFLALRGLTGMFPGPAPVPTPTPIVVVPTPTPTPVPTSPPANVEVHTSPQQAVDAFCSYLRTGDESDAYYRVLSSDFQQRNPYSQFQPAYYQQVCGGSTALTAIANGYQITIRILGNNVANDCTYAIYDYSNDNGTGGGGWLIGDSNCRRV